MPGIFGAFDVFNPHVLDAIQHAVFEFCEATNASVIGDLDKALENLRWAIAGGLQGGDALATITRDVQAIFRDPYRAHRIAATESSRAVHAGQMIAAQQSGVCSGLRWLASADACDFCLALDGKEVAFGEVFTVQGNNPNYSRILHPPAHPFCMCAATEVIA